MIEFLLQPIVQVPSVHLGPFTLTMDVSITSLASLITLIVVAVKLIRHLTRVDDKVDQLWLAMMGNGPQDDVAFFSRFTLMEQRVAQLWGAVFERRNKPRE